MAGGMIERAAGVRVPAGQMRRLRPHRGGRRWRSFMAVGSLVQAIHSVEGSVASAERWPRSPGRTSEFAPS